MLALGLSSSIPFLFTFHRLLYTYKPLLYTYYKSYLRRHITSHHTSAYWLSLTLYHILKGFTNLQLLSAQAQLLVLGSTNFIPKRNCNLTILSSFLFLRYSGSLGWHHQGRLAVDLAAVPRSQIHQPFSLPIRACSRHLYSTQKDVIL